MNIPEPSNPIRSKEIAGDENNSLKVFMVEGETEGTFNVFAMEWSSVNGGQTASGAIKIGPDLYSTRQEADERFDSIVEAWS